MRTFNVYKHPTEGFEAVKIGFSWPALIFGVFWMLVSSLWLFAALWFVMLISLRVIEEVLFRQEPSLPQILFLLVTIVVSLILWLVPAFKGNGWRDAKLTKQGYKCVATIQARSSAAATAQAMDAA